MICSSLQTGSHGPEIQMSYLSKDVLFHSCIARGWLHITENLEMLSENMKTHLNKMFLSFMPCFSHQIRMIRKLRKESQLGDGWHGCGSSHRKSEKSFWNDI